MMYDKLNFGTAGVPRTAKTRSLIDGINRVKELNLDNLEIEFVRQVYVKSDKTAEIKKHAEENNVNFTCHGQYYINLNSKEVEKIEASKIRIYNAAKIAHQCGAKSLTFHAGFYQKMDPKLTYDNIKKGLLEVSEKLKAENITIPLRPETTGKATQFGSFEELIKLGQELNSPPCIDFAHLHARNGKGLFNTHSEFHKCLTTLEKELDCLKNMHIHMAGIHYSEKGERNHLNLEESDFNWRELLKVWKEFDIKGNVTCESPNIEDDAILMRDYYRKL